MIEAHKAEGNKAVARCVCDVCGAETTFPATIKDTVKGNTFVRKIELAEVGAVNRRLMEKGWTIISKKLRCPACEQTRRAHKEKPMTNVEPIRQPSREQKRQIIEMLTAVYDTAAERYIGTETDVTVAEAIGGGCMFGWVAAIREDMFGPEGGNEEHIALVADMALWRANADKLADEMAGSLREFNECRAKVKELETRFAAVVKALGPKVKSA